MEANTSNQIPNSPHQYWYLFHISIVFRNRHPYTGMEITTQPDNNCVANQVLLNWMFWKHSKICVWLMKKAIKLLKLIVRCHIVAKKKHNFMAKSIRRFFSMFDVCFINTLSWIQMAEKWRQKSHSNVKMEIFLRGLWNTKICTINNRITEKILRRNYLGLLYYVEYNWPDKNVTEKLSENKQKYWVSECNSTIHLEVIEVTLWILSVPSFNLLNSGTGWFKVRAIEGKESINKQEKYCWIFTSCICCSWFQSYLLNCQHFELTQILFLWQIKEWKLRFDELIYTSKQKESHEFDYSINVDSLLNNVRCILFHGSERCVTIITIAEIIFVWLNKWHDVTECLLTYCVT